jgi:hypothetical protein
MRGMRLTTFAVAGMAILLPVTVPAQARSSADLFLLQNDALVGSTPLYGIGFTMGSGMIGLRVSGAAAFQSTTDRNGEETYGMGAYGADADVVINVASLGLTGTGSSGRAGVSPYAFAGLGVLGRRLADGELSYSGSEWERGPSASFGGGMAASLGDALSADASARYRTAVGDSSQWVAGFPRGWEYRVGFKLSLGRSPSRETPRTAGRTSRGGRSGGGILEQMGVLLPSGSTVGSSAAAVRIVNTADQYLGVPYVWGGETPKGFDCSGFTKYVFAKNGIELPRTSRQQVQVGEKVATSLSSLRTGDLIFFAENYSRVDHVAIYVGDGRIIHATSSGREVRYDDLRSQRGTWFMEHMVAARRYTGNTSAWDGVLAQLLTQAVKEYDRGDKAPRPR